LKGIPSPFGKAGSYKRWINGDNGRVMYHGRYGELPASLDDVGTKRSQLQTEGLYVTPRSDLVKYWVTEDVPGSNVTPLVVKGKYATPDTLLDKSMLDRTGVKYKDTGGDITIKDIFGQSDEPNAAFTKQMLDDGYAGIDYGKQMVVFDPYSIKGLLNKTFTDANDMFKAVVPGSLIPALDNEE
jgi:hypothetical protein